LLLGSGIAVMVIQAFAMALHVSKAGTYYGAGERLGLSAESPHELALIGVMLAIACLVSVRDTRMRLAGAAVAATPALATGVRSALVALALSLVVLAIRARFRPSAVLAIAVIGVVIIFSGVGAILVARYEEGKARGEYSTLAAVGSGRGTVWKTDLASWRASDPATLATGEGLRSVQRIQKQATGSEATAQSDPVTILVEFGLLGLAGWLLMWLSLVRCRVNWLVLLPLASFAVTNGSLEYVGAVVFGLALAGACASPSRGPWGRNRHRVYRRIGSPP
jgi:hypothetical protein